MSVKEASSELLGNPCQVRFLSDTDQTNKSTHRYSILPDLSNGHENILHSNKPPRRPRRSIIHAARNQRTFEHIESYVKIIVFVSLNCFFSVTTSRSSTIEELARLIEAEYAFNYSCSPALTSSLDYVKESNQSLKQLLDKDLMEDLTESELLGPEQILGEEGESNTKPLICGAIFLEKEELIFSDFVGDVLSSNDIVRVVNIYEDLSINGDLEEDIFSGDTRRWSCPSGKLRSCDDLLAEKRAYVGLLRHQSVKRSDIFGVNKLPSTPRDKSPNVKIHTIFQNKISLNYFREFCLKVHALENLHFWIEVEVYRCTKSSLVSVIADYLYKVYIAQDGPLRINIPEEIRKTIPIPRLSPESLPNINIFDEAQEYVFDLLVQYIIPQFEASDLYTKLVRDRTTDSANFELAYMGEPVTKWLQFDIGTVANVMDIISKYRESKLNMRYSLQERENILEQVTNQMFSPITMSSYYTTPRYPASEHSGKKMMLKKKLAKLLGQRSMEKQTIQQFIDESVLTCTSSLISTKEKDHIPADNDKNTLKKKKIEKLEKLEGFFGKKLSNSQLAHQNLVNSVEEPKFSDIIEPPGSLTLCPLVTYNDLSPEERRLLTKRTRKLKLLFGEPMDEQLVSKSLTNPIIAQKLLTDDSEKSLFYNFESHVTESEDFEIHPNEKRLMSRRNSKEIKRKKLGKLYQLLGVYPSSNEIEKGTPPVGDVKETLIHRNAKTAPPEIRKLQLKRANKLEKVFGQHPPKEFITVNKETELPFQKRSSVVSNLLDAEDSVEDMVHYLEILSAMNDESTDNSGVLSSDNLDDESNEEISEDNTSQDSILETNKSTRQKKLSKLRRFFGNDLGLESLIAQNILLRRELVAESIYDIGEDSEIYGQHLNAFRFGRDEASEMYIRNAMKNDLEQLRREVQELHRLNSHNSSQNSFMKRLTRTTTISRPNTLLSRHSIASTDSKNSDLKYKEG